MNELTALIQQAMDNGDTATARALSRALENQTKISTVPVPVQQEEYYYPQQQVYTQQPQYIEELVYANRQASPQQGISISTIFCLVILPYLAVAEVLAPGHQGPLKIHQTKLAWPIEMVGGMFPKGEVADAQSE